MYFFPATGYSLPELIVYVFASYSVRYELNFGTFYVISWFQNFNLSLLLGPV